MFVSDVSDFLFVGKVEPYFLSAGEEVQKSKIGCNSKTIFFSQTRICIRGVYVYICIGA